MFTSIADYDDLRENILLLVNDYMHLNSGQYIQPNLHDNAARDLTAIFLLTLKPVLGADADTEEMIRTNVEESLSRFYKHIAPQRSNGPSFIRVKPNLAKLRAKINYLQSVPQPEQRTPEWYAFRYQHLTASNIWKIFISDSTRNQLIYEKCQPLNTSKYSTNVSLESPMHWGQKYEPLSVMLYEELYAAKVSDFGCIPHRTLEFLAASPDGIVTDEKSLRYGRMLEVKNIFNREITGTPKMEYWVQMQLQMEVCELNECDFLETRFKEYADQDAFEADAAAEPDEKRGMLMLFMTGDGKPVYEYAPLNICPGNSLGNSLGNMYESWQEEMMEKNKALMWVKNIYWKLDELSCVLVLRNKFWFAAALPQIKDIWAPIEKETETGYSHREPKKNNTLRVKKLQPDEDTLLTTQCFIQTHTL